MLERFLHKNARVVNILKESKMALRVGQSAPDFVLDSHLDRQIHLSDYLGKVNVVLAFFPLAWTPI
jgi:peroxiredoxin